MINKSITANFNQANIFNPTVATSIKQKFSYLIYQTKQPKICYQSINYYQTKNKFTVNPLTTINPFTKCHYQIHRYCNTKMTSHQMLSANDQSASIPISNTIH